MAVELVQPLLHRLAQVVAAAAERGVALVDEVALLPGQRQRRAMAVGFRARDRPQEDVVDVAVELGEAGIGADRLFHRTLRGGAIEARQVLLRSQRAQPFDFERDLLVVVGRGFVGGIEADRLGIILQRAGAVALAAPGRAAVVVGALEFRIQFQRRVVIRDRAVIFLHGLIGVAAIGQEFRLGTHFDRLVEVGDRARVVAIVGEMQAAIVEELRLGRIDPDRRGVVRKRAFGAAELAPRPCRGWYRSARCSDRGGSPRRNRRSPSDTRP